MEDHYIIRANLSIPTAVVLKVNVRSEGFPKTLSAAFKHAVFPALEFPQR